jgi:hypothetical protein
MKRREFVGKLGIGSAVVASGAALAKGLSTPATAAQAVHNHAQVTGPLASATVSFGQWLTDPAFDRFPNLNTRTANQHLLIPYIATIRAGGSVNFIVGGFHHILVYEPGTQTTDIDATLLVPPTGQPAPLLINDPTGRVYRGLDPSLFPQDRVEVVTLANPGKYLVICGVQPHFVDDKMHGFVEVLPG